MEDFKFTNEQIEEIANWTLSGLSMYYRDAQLSESEIQKYHVGQIFRSQTFIDVSNFAGKLTKNCRFIFATNKAAPLYQLNPATEKWKLHTINANSYFKVLDIYKKDDKIQFFLLHIPANGIDFFRNTVLRLGGDNLEEQIIEKSRISLDQKMEMDVIPELEEQEWVHRTNFPIGLDVKGNFFSLQPTEEMMPQAIPLYNAIFKVTNDTKLNIPKIVKQDRAEEKDNNPIFKLTGFTQQTSDMTTYEQIKKVMEGKKGMVVTSGFVKSEVERKYGRNISSVIPSDYCYNRINDGIDFRKDNRLFKYNGRNSYEYLGEGFPYTGKIYHKPYKSKEEIVVGEWINGKMKYPA